MNPWQFAFVESHRTTVLSACCIIWRLISACESSPSYKPEGLMALQERMARSARKLSRKEHAKSPMME